MSKMKSAFDVKANERLEPAYDLPGTRYWLALKKAAMGPIYAVYAHEYFGYRKPKFQTAKEYPKLTKALDYEAGESAVCMRAGAHRVVDLIRREAS